MRLGSNCPEGSYATVDVSSSKAIASMVFWHHNAQVLNTWTLKVVELAYRALFEIKKSLGTRNRLEEEIAYNKYRLEPSSPKLHINPRLAQSGTRSPSARRRPTSADVGLALPCPCSSSGMCLTTLTSSKQRWCPGIEGCRGFRAEAWVRAKELHKHRDLIPAVSSRGSHAEVLNCLQPVGALLRQ